MFIDMITIPHPLYALIEQITTNKLPQLMLIIRILSASGQSSPGFDKY